MSQQNDLVEALSAETSKLKCSGISLKLKANERVVEELFNTGLVGKLLADRNINKNVVKAIILKVWRTSKGVQIVDLRENMFLFKFSYEGDRKRIMELGPWNIEGYPLILKPWNQNMAVEDLEFSSLPIWIQVHNLPIEYMSKENDEEIGAMVGKVLEVDFTGNGGVCMSKFIRVKIELKIEDPLWSGFFLDRSTNVDLWIQFKYERVADFCYKCGRLGHLKARCPRTESTARNSDGKEPYGFGPWMKAENVGKRTTRWVEFLADIDKSEEGILKGHQNSKESKAEWRVEHAPEKTSIENQFSSSNDLVEGSRNFLTKFDESAANVTSKQLCPGKPLQLSSLSKPTNLPMETEISDVTNPHVSNINQTNNPSQDSDCGVIPKIQTLDPETSRTIPQISNPLDQPNGPTTASEITDPTLLIGLSKAQSNMLSWTIFYNEGEPNLSIGPEHLQGSSVSQKNESYKVGVKRKLEAEDWLPSNRVIKLTKVGSGLLEIAHQPTSQTIKAQQRNTSKCSPIRKKKR
ncbi:uncharacterized protein LOC126719632 [Quercus robur]|uniref:uncharacterized protein LOC126719632 n=1 Tax=Quercus robur TaxID=38942 RepID=UPI0021619DEB|nr:uncharacterized protein LOC126719632 [Quercus robur]